MIYADNAATTKLSKKAFISMQKYLLDNYGNPSQLYSFGQESKKAIEKSRETIAKIINCETEEIFFTSGGTESDNWVIKQFDDGVLTSKIEHHAILNSCKKIKNVKYLDVNNNGLVQYKNTQVNGYPLMSVMFANNEIGTIQPIADLAKFAHKNGMKFHTDAVQAVGHIEIDVKKLDIDFLSASAHKFHGPKGIGFLYANKKCGLPAFINGGSQEMSKRAGTENVASIVAMATALEEINNNLAINARHLKKLESIVLDKLKAAKIDFINNSKIDHLPGLLSISIKGVSGEAILHHLDLMDICISSGSACDSKNKQISHVIKAIKVPAEYAKGTIRISFCANNTKKEAQIISEAIIKSTNLIYKKRQL